MAASSDKRSHSSTKAMTALDERQCGSVKTVRGGEQGIHRSRCAVLNIPRPESFGRPGNRLPIEVGQGEHT